jgi:hypothetical protein
MIYSEPTIRAMLLARLDELTAIGGPPSITWLVQGRGGDRRLIAAVEALAREGVLRIESERNGSVITRRVHRA